MADKTTECINGELKINDIVLVNSIEGRYGCLVGNVIAIDKRGSPDHDTDNPGDDIHVNFADSEYTNWRILEIEKTFSDNGQRKPLAEIALDDVIMSPEMLINVTHIKHREFAKILSSFDNAKNFGDTLLRDYFEDLKQKLTERIEKNFADYTHSLLDFGKQELIDMAGKIQAMDDAYFHSVNYHDFTDEELKFYIQFDNPLKIISDYWRGHTSDLSDMSFSMDYIIECKNIVAEQYDKVDSKADLSDSPHRYMHVDLQDFLGKIAAEIIVYHPKDVDIDMETFREAAACDDFIDRRFVWLVSEKGTNTPLEFEAFQKNTDPYRYTTESHSYSGITPYIVEVTGIDKDEKVIGNVFEAGEYREFANRVKENSVANDMIAIHYHDGEKNTIPRERYAQNPAKYNTMHGYPLPEFRYYPADEQSHLEFLQQERDTRMQLPIGVENQHIKKIAKRMAAINANQEIAKKPQSKAIQKKSNIADKLEKAIEKSKSQTLKKSAKTKKKQEEL